MKLKQKSIRKFRFCHFPDKREWKFYLLHKFNQRYLSFMSKNDDFFLEKPDSLRIVNERDQPEMLLGQPFMSLIGKPFVCQKMCVFSEIIKHLTN